MGGSRPIIPAINITDIFYLIFISKAVDIEPELYEGDIVLPSNPDQSNELREKRNARRLRQYIWKTKIVPYEVSDQLGKISFLIYIGHKTFGRLRL